MTKSETFCPNCPNWPENRTLRSTRRSRVLFHRDDTVTYETGGRNGCLGEIEKATGKPLELLQQEAQHCERPTEIKVPHDRTLLGRLGLSKDTIVECPVTEGLFDPASETEVTDYFEHFDSTAYAVWRAVREGASQ